MAHPDVPVKGNEAGDALRRGPAGMRTDETKDRYPDGLVVSIGSRKEEETIAHQLYEVLRDFDQSAVRSIYSEAFYTP